MTGVSSDRRTPQPIGVRRFTYLEVFVALVAFGTGTAAYLTGGELLEFSAVLLGAVGLTLVISRLLLHPGG